VKLDLGCGPVPAEGFEGVDRLPGAHHQFELATGSPWPWADSSIEALRCSHFIEHVPAVDVFVEQPGYWIDALARFFDEAWRVIVPGGIFEVIWPALQSDSAFQDPTHRRFIPPKQLAYWNREFRQNNRLGFLGARCHWVVERCDGTPMRELPPDPKEQLHAVLTEWNAVAEYRALLRAVKP
jgi:SAM-dependent methyltransferase